MESKVSFGIRILWAIQWLWKVSLYVLQKPRKWQKQSGPNDMGHPVIRVPVLLSLCCKICYSKVINAFLNVVDKPGPPRVHWARCIGFHKATQNLPFLPLQHIIKYQPGHCLRSGRSGCKCSKVQGSLDDKWF